MGSLSYALFDFKVRERKRSSDYKIAVKNGERKKIATLFSIFYFIRLALVSNFNLCSKVNSKLSIRRQRQTCFALIHKSIIYVYKYTKLLLGQLQCQVQVNQLPMYTHTDTHTHAYADSQRHVRLSSVIVVVAALWWAKVSWIYFEGELQRANAQTPKYIYTHTYRYKHISTRFTFVCQSMSRLNACAPL